MKHEEIIKRANGDSYNISCAIYIDSISKRRIAVYIKPKGKRKTKEEILQAKLNLWNKLKPE